MMVKTLILGVLGAAFVFAVTQKRLGRIIGAIAALALFGAALWLGMPHE